MTDKEIIITELDRLITELVEEGENTMFEQGRISAFEDVKVFIDSLQEDSIEYNPFDDFRHTDSEEPVSEDLEEDVSKYLNDIIGDYQRENCDTDADYLMSKEDMLEFARHFADWQNQQMIKNAITAHCFGFQNPDALFSFKQPAENYLVGSELKVVIIKED